MKSTTRRTLSRLDRKRERAAAREAMHRGYGRRTEVRAGHKSTRPPLIDDEIQIGNRRKRKPKFKELYCPARSGQRRHHYLTETYDDDSWWSGPRTYKLCVHCGDEPNGPEPLEDETARLLRKWGL